MGQGYSKPSKTNKAFNERRNVKCPLDELTIKHLERLEKLYQRRSNERALEVRKTIKINGGEAGEGEVKGKDEAGRGRKCFILALPDEVLEIILEKVTSPKDIGACYFSCERFRNLLKPRSAEFLFPKVLSYLLGYLSQEEYFNCRLVSRCTNEYFTKVLEGIYYPEDILDPDRARQKSFRLESLYGHFCFDFLYNQSTLDRLIQQIDNNEVPLNPFLARRAKVGNPYGNRDYWRKVHRILSHVGEDIWEICICLMNPPEEKEPLQEAEDLICTVRECLLYLPNLKRLQINSPCMDSQFKFTKPTLALLRQQFANRPFPTLPHLTELILQDACLLSFHLLPTQYWRQLRRLRLHYCDCKLTPFFTASPTQLAEWVPNLQVLELDYWWCSVEDLAKFAWLKCPLETLVISQCDIRGLNDMTPFLEALSHFGPTLRNLRIYQNHCSGYTAPPTSRYFKACLQFHAPNLKTLKLTNIPDSLIFLLCCESLERLSFLRQYGSWRLRSHEHSELMKVHGYFDRMWESNIWMKLPELKQVLFAAMEGDITTDPISIPTYEMYFYKRDGNEVVLVNR